jgi:hypothetical protein
MAAIDLELSESDSIKAATVRLALALDGLDAAAERRREADRDERARSEHLAALGDDRARLASELDEATARARGLETASREVAERIDQAIATIRTVLGSDE